MAKSYIKQLSKDIFLMDGVKYDTSKFKSALIDWKCPKCGFSKLAYDLDLAASEHAPSCKKIQNKNKKKLSKKASETLKDLGIL